MLQANLINSKEFILQEVEPPVPKADEVLIQVALAGICGSDLHAYHGKHPFISFPIVLGHEFSGTIVGLGERVPKGKFELGQRVTVEPSLVCGACYNCRNGRYNICDELKVIGCQTDGAYKELIAVPEQKVIPLDHRLGFDDGAMLEPLAVAVHAVERGNVKTGDKVLVIGAGTIGLLLAQAAKASGAQVVVADIVETRLNIALQLEVDGVIHSKSEDIQKSLWSKFKDGADVIFECVGIPQTVRQAVTLARKGSRIVIVGVIGEEVLLPVGLIQDRELELVGDLMYTRKDFELAQNYVLQGHVKLDKLKSKVFPLVEIKQAFEYVCSHPETTLKVFLQIHGSITNRF